MKAGPFILWVCRNPAGVGSAYEKGSVLIIDNFGWGVVRGSARAEGAEGGGQRSEDGRRGWERHGDAETRG